VANPENRSKNPDKDIRRLRRRQYTIWGIFFISLLVLLSVYTGGFFLYSAVAVAVLLLFSLAISSANLVGIKVQRDLSASEIKWGETVEAKLTVINQKSLSAFWLFWEDYVDKALDVEGPICHFKTLAPNKSHKLPFRIHSTHRGFFKIGPAMVESSGPFGLIQRFLVGQQVDFLTVLPRVVPVEKGLVRGQRPIHQIPKRMSIFEDPSRFLGVREYQPGDSLRRIHWKATARSRTIQVKIFEPAVLLGALLTVDMHPASYLEVTKEKEKVDSLVELAITAAASLGEYIITGDQRVGLLSNGEDAAEQYKEEWKGGIFRRIDQVREYSRMDLRSLTFQPVELAPGKGQPQLEQLHAALARLVFTENYTLPDLLMTELPRLPRSLVLVVITPHIDQALNNALGSLQRSGIETAVVWVRDPEEPFLPEAGITHNIPVYPVRRDEDLVQLGAISI